MSHFIPVPLELKEANAFVDQFHRTEINSELVL